MVTRVSPTRQPVGASTLACALRYPFRSPAPMASAHALVASLSMAASSVPIARTESLAAACLRITRLCASALRA